MGLVLRRHEAGANVLQDPEPLGAIRRRIGGRKVIQGKLAFLRPVAGTIVTKFAENRLNVFGKFCLAGNTCADERGESDGEQTDCASTKGWTRIPPEMRRENLLRFRDHRY